MDITYTDEEKNIINSYGENSFVINNKVYYGSHIIHPNSVIPFLDFNHNNIKHLDYIINGGYQEEDSILILVGTGEYCTNVSTEVRSYVKTKKRVAFEFMETSIACGVYNILLSGTRRVCTALTAIKPQHYDRNNN